MHAGDANESVDGVAAPADHARVVADQRCAVAAALGSDTAQPAPRALYTATKDVAVSVRVWDRSNSAPKAGRSASRTSGKSIKPPSDSVRARSAGLSLAAAAG